MSESDSWSDHDAASDSADARLHARAVAEQMRAATTRLRARLSVVPDADGDATSPPSG
jgi:hypothetical protein